MIFTSNKIRYSKIKVYYKNKKNKLIIKKIFQEKIILQIKFIKINKINKLQQINNNKLIIDKIDLYKIFKMNKLKNK